MKRVFPWFTIVNGYFINYDLLAVFMKHLIFLAKDARGRFLARSWSEKKIRYLGGRGKSYTKQTLGTSKNIGTFAIVLIFNISRRIIECFPRTLKYL